MKQVAFIAGPYRSDNRWTEIQNVWRASVVSAHYWRRGYAVICPHAMTSQIVGCVSEEKFVPGLRELVRLLRPASDRVIVLPGWSDSPGTKGEIAEACQCNISIIEVFYQAEMFGKRVAACPVVREYKEMTSELTEFINKL